MGLTNAQLFDRWVDWNQKAYQQEHAIMRRALEQIADHPVDAEDIALGALAAVAKSEDDRVFLRQPKGED